MSEFLTIEDLVGRLETTRSTLAHWRVQGIGPSWIKVGRKVLYPLGAVGAFEAERLRQGGHRAREESGIDQAVRRRVANDPTIMEAIRVLARWGFETRWCAPSVFLPPFIRAITAELAGEWERLAKADKLRPGYPDRPNA